MCQFCCPGRSCSVCGAITPVCQPVTEYVPTGEPLTDDMLTDEDVRALVYRAVRLRMPQARTVAMHKNDCY